MPAASVLVPSALLAAAAALIWGLEAAGVRAARWAAPAAAWLALVGLIATWWAAGRVTVELNLPGTVAGAPLALRLDPIGVAFGLVVLLPTALLFTFQRRAASEAALAAMAASASLLAIEAGSLLLTAVALGTCATLVMLALRQEDPERPTTLYWISLGVGGLLLLWAGAVLEVTGGTSVYSAAPITALRVPVFLLLAGAGLLCSGLLPWGSWLPAMWGRDRLEAGALSIALLSPLGFLPLTRAYLLGAGQWPGVGLNLAMAALGAAAALAAGLRAQAASSQLAFLAEAVPLGGGLALLALSLGSPFGVSAAVLTLVGVGLTVGVAPLLPAGRWLSTILGAAVIVGVPPALVFGGRLLAVQAAVEAGGVLGFLGILAAAAWLLALASAARLAWLPTGSENKLVKGHLGAYFGLALAIVGGVALGAVETLLGLPVAAEAIGSPTPAVTGGYIAVITASGGWPSLTLAGPLLLLAVGAALLSRPAWRRWQARPLALNPPPPPFVGVPPVPLRGRLRGTAPDLRLLEQYRSMLNLPAVEAAAAVGRPWLWGAVTLALIIVVTR